MKLYFWNMNKNADLIIEMLELIEHPEGGYYKETYRSAELMSFEGFSGPRNIGTSIYFLMKGGQSTLPHRIKVMKYGFIKTVVLAKLLN